MLRVALMKLLYNAFQRLKNNISWGGVKTHNFFYFFIFFDQKKKELGHDIFYVFMSSLKKKHLFSITSDISILLLSLP